MIDLIIIAFFKATVATGFAVALSFLFKETQKNYIAYIYWFVGLFAVVLNLHGAFNCIVEILTGDYLAFNVVNLVCAFVIYFIIGTIKFNKL